MRFPFTLTTKNYGSGQVRASNCSDSKKTGSRSALHPLYASVTVVSELLLLLLLLLLDESESSGIHGFACGTSAVELSATFVLQAVDVILNCCAAFLLRIHKYTPC